MRVNSKTIFITLLVFCTFHHLYIVYTAIIYSYKKIIIVNFKFAVPNQNGVMHWSLTYRLSLKDASHRVAKNSVWPTISNRRYYLDAIKGSTWANFKGCCA